MTTTLLHEYRDLIDLDEVFRPAAEPAPAAAHDTLVGELLPLLAAGRAIPAAGDAGSRRALLRALLTVRGPGPLPPDAVPKLDALLGGERQARHTVDAAGLPTIADGYPGTGYPAAERTVLWQGDITALRAGAVVNAANDRLLGCFQPDHRCVDNVIHAAAGPRLRADCATITGTRPGPEPSGTATITRGYHLPADYVIHTVGPIVDGPLRPGHVRTLAHAYTSCLDLAAEAAGIRTLAFCSISTGLFGFPAARAARIALDTVAAWLAARPGLPLRVIFDVWSTADLDHYRHALTEKDPS
ncbi:macro domain-containing protein [Actinoplanes sp. NBRC 101535]|uniref:macro domain-containing protein n=1 Tax=Actinoplanes sp. NBRC 101535 TaxID=3032196 RepID=UPI0024A3F0CC|nr:macro domain-containing protein [Actinoplanes sp. NBRC 101535]GLY06663.1 hypothetical protein Acsp01_70420 [Actinoplanes sp. NBRC 101535]